jgi:hypothetical protein
MPEVRGAHGGVLNRTLLSVNGQRERGVVEQLNKPARRLSCSRNSGPSASQALWIFDDLDEEPERTFRSRLGMDKNTVVPREPRRGALSISWNPLAFMTSKASFASFTRKATCARPPRPTFLDQFLHGRLGS